MAKTYRTKFFVTLVAVAAAFVLQIAPTYAATEDGSYIIVGEDGMLLCSQLERDFSTFSEALAWAGGYLTALNYTQPDLYNLAAGTNWAPWLRTYCASNPTKKFAYAVNALSLALWPGRQVTAPATVIPPAPQPSQRQVPVKRTPRSLQY